MSNEATSNVEDVKTSAVSGPVTESDLLAIRMKAYLAPEESVKPEEMVAEESVQEEETVLVDDTKEEASSEPTAEVEAAKDGDVLSQFDLDKLSDEQIQALAAKSRSKAISRFGEMTAKNKELAARLAQAEAALNASRPVQPIESQVDIPSEIAKLDSVEAIQAKHREAKEAIRFYEDVLDKADNMAPDDVITEVNGYSLTKAMAKKLKREASHTIEDVLPAQLQALQVKAQRQVLRQQSMVKAQEEIAWMKDEASDLRKQYDAIVNQPIIEKIRQAVPEAAIDLDYIIAHATNSIHGKTYYELANSKKTEAKSVKLTPPSSIKSVAVGRGEVQIKQVKELEKRLSQTNSFEDLKRLRTAQLSAKI
jgi:hypothetical protein